jgi:ribonuclease J
VAVIVAIDSRYNKILCRPTIVSRGFVYIKDSQPLLKQAELIVYNALVNKMQERTTFGELKNCIRSSLEPYLFQKTHRNPIVIPVILNQKAAIAEIKAKTGGRAHTARRTTRKPAAAPAESK